MISSVFYLLLKFYDFKKYFFFTVITINLLLLFDYRINAQQKLAPEVYMVKFIDKNFNVYTLTKPQQFLSERAITRRSKQNISIKENDLPVSNFYTDSLEKLGLEIIHTSKWLNAAAIIITDSSQLELIQDLSFIQKNLTSEQQKTIPSATNKFLIANKLNNIKSYRVNDYGPSFNQIALHNGQYLHLSGFRGKGIIIAVLDAGFSAVKEYSSLSGLWFENRVLLTRDLVDKTGVSFYDHSHGSYVLSIMAANSPENLIGTAPEADYILIRTENALSEYPVEEFNWIVGAELADSSGADIIHSSLGYSTFDDPSLNYTYSQMDGKSAISSIGATIAASKGIIVVSSAGNEGGNYWKYITAPADADSIITVGAIDDAGNRAYFSSFGPTADKRIKPDVMAKGFQTYIQFSPNSFYTANGTSLSAPIISGLTACLWQAFPKMSSIEIINTIKNYSSLYANPDTIKGYGIPDFFKALYALNPNLYLFKNKLFVYPNPCFDNFTIEFEPVPIENSILTITDLTGKTIVEIQLTANTQLPNEFQINYLANKPKGVYLLRLSSGSSVFKGKVIKI